MEYKVRLDTDDHGHRQNQPIKYLVIHFTGNMNDTDEGNANYFCTGYRESSAHYFVDDDSCTQVVPIERAAWHVGDGYGKYGITNMNSIGIEMCATNGGISGKTEQNTIELVKKLMKQFNVPVSNVVRHYDASRKNCPSPFAPNNWARWNSFKSKLNNKEEIDMFIVDVAQNFKNSDNRVRGQIGYATRNQYVYDEKGNALKINGKEYILRTGTEVKMFRAESNDRINCYPTKELGDAGYNGMFVARIANWDKEESKVRLAIPKLIGDEPYKEIIKEVIKEVMVPAPVTRESCLEFLNKNL